MLLKKSVKHSPAKDESRYHGDGVCNGQGEQHLDVLGENVGIRVVHCGYYYSLVNHKISCYNSIGNKDNDEVDDNIGNDEIAGMNTISEITAIDGVAPFKVTCNAEGIRRDDKKTPKPDKKNYKVNSSISKHNIIMLSMV